MDIKDKQRGARLEALRSAKGISQIELAKYLGYKSDSTISKWEAGASIPTGGKLVEIAKLLETTTDYILFGNSNIVLGDNHGVNGLEASGSNNTNTYNFNASSEKQDAHNATMQELAALDSDVQVHLLKLLTQQVALMYEKTEMQKRIDRNLATLIEINEEILDEIKKLAQVKEK